MERIGIGLVGCGSRLRDVVRHVFAATDRVDVRALCDPNPDSVRAAREEFNPDAAVHETCRGLCDRPDIEWVFIGSWNRLHREHAEAAFEAGKHVFLEKPLATTVEDCLAVREAWRASGKRFGIGFTLRYSPHYRRIREIVEAGEIGRVLSFEFNETLDFNHGGFIHADWRRKTAWAGSHVLEKCCHDLDVANWILGSHPVLAASFGGCDFFTAAHGDEAARVGPRGDGVEAFGAMTAGRLAQGRVLGNTGNPFTDDKDIVDNQVAILRYANGARATFHTNCVTAIPERRFYLCGTEGTLRADVLSGGIQVRRIGFDTPLQDRSTVASGGHGQGDPVLGAALAEAIVRGAELPAGLDEGLRAAFAAFGIDRAMASGQVEDLRPMWRLAGLAE